MKEFHDSSTRNGHDIELKNLSRSVSSEDMYTEEANSRFQPSGDFEEGEASNLLTAEADPASATNARFSSDDGATVYTPEDGIGMVPSSRYTNTTGFLRALGKTIWKGPVNPKDNPPRQIKLLALYENIPFKFKQIIPSYLWNLGLIVYFALWFSLCYSILIPYLTVSPAFDDDPNTIVVPVSCAGPPMFWNGKNGECGFNGELCPSFSEKEIVFRCPALCDKGSITYSLIPIGDQLIKYRGYFVGGGALPEPGLGEGGDNEEGLISKPYRADSYPCGAAIHAGVVSPFVGGCAKIKYTGAQGEFQSASGNYGVDVSIPFLSFFQESFSFIQLGAGYSRCYDPRLLILVINIILGLPIMYLGSGLLAYWTINTVGFWTIALATDPPRTIDASDFENFADLISLSLGRFLPTCFILYVLWHCSVSRTLRTAYLDYTPTGISLDGDDDFREERATDARDQESDRKPSVLYKLFLFYPLFWLGVLNNVTFDRLPVDRLTISDLKTQPGAIFAVGFIITLIIVCAFIQAYKIWLSGRFRKYLMIYLLFVLGLVVIANLPGLTLRIHHYILAMILIPGCATRGRTALMFQGILLGLFLSGASRWGLAAIAETAGSLKRDDPQGTIIPPVFQFFNSTSGLLSWTDIDGASLTPIDKKLYEQFNQYSLLINDVERFVLSTAETSMNLTKLLGTEKLSKLIQGSLDHGFKDKLGDISIYLRIGRKISGSATYSDFSKAAVLQWPSGEMSLPDIGLT